MSNKFLSTHLNHIIEVPQDPQLWWDRYYYEVRISSLVKARQDLDITDKNTSQQYSATKPLFYSLRNAPIVTPRHTIPVTTYTRKI